ncbi:MAG: Type 1 glutamine amidotransferase-like domain-containing protein [Clostridia bacterium]|nr:Type 1 glutamine amidotransferase-like domain-containing protein [Clostridia bacterium]
MLILTSNGLSSNNLLDATRQYIKEGRAALVVTADNEYKAKNYHISRLTNELQALGLQVEYFDFDYQSPTEFMSYDIVEMIGGNPYYLLNSIRKNCFLGALEYFSQNKCIIGCSAGALVLTPTLNLINLYSPEMNIVGLKDLSACNLTNIQILPHYSKFIKRYNGFEEKCLQYEYFNKCEVIRLNDGEGVIIQDSYVNVIK